MRSRFYSGVFAYVFGILAILMSFFAVLSATGILIPSSGSIIQGRYIAIILAVLGAIFCVSYLTLRFISKRAEKRYLNIIKNGIKIEGEVLNISHKFYIRINRRCPYIITYSFKHDGSSINVTSQLIWEMPHIRVGDSIDVYISDTGESALNI